MIRKLEKLLDEKIRPGLKSHSGDVEIVDYDNNVLFVKLKGGCQGCSSSKATLKDGIKRLVCETYPEIKDVVDLTDHMKGENPYYK